MNPAGYAFGCPAVEDLLSTVDTLLGGPWPSEPEKDWVEEARRAKEGATARMQDTDTTRKPTGKKQAAQKPVQDEMPGYRTVSDDRLGWGNASVRSYSIARAMEKRRKRKPVCLPADCHPGRAQGFRRYQHDYVSPALEPRGPRGPRGPEWLEPQEFDTSAGADRQAHLTHAYIVAPTSAAIRATDYSDRPRTPRGGH